MKYPKKVTDLECPECGEFMELRDSKYGPFYGCSAYPDCDSTHGAHPHGAPLGIPADKETKQWRMKCHEVFDQLWKDEKYGYSRTEAYDLLRGILCIDSKDCHIGMFDIVTCKRAIQKLEKYYIKK